jgi:aminopeptidase C
MFIWAFLVKMKTSGHGLMAGHTFRMIRRMMEEVEAKKAERTKKAKSLLPFALLVFLGFHHREAQLSNVSRRQGRVCFASMAQRCQL